jgi:hypothetical protein
MLCSRRHLFEMSAFGLAGIAAGSLMKQEGLLGQEATLEKPNLEADLLPKPPARPAKAKAMISMFMIGGPSQIDLFDPKPELDKYDGTDFQGDLHYDNAAQSSRKLMKTLSTFQKRGQCGMELSDLIPHISEIADDITLIRSMQTDVNNHIPSMFSLQTGSSVPGRASMGAWLLKALGSESQELPAYVALTHPSGMPLMGGDNWNNGALPSIFQGTVVRPTEPRILNLDPPKFLVGQPQRAQLELIERLNAQHLASHPGESDLAARIASYELAAKMQTSAKAAFDISDEPQHILDMYGVSEDRTRDYATRCLIARRLVERGVRFVQIFNNGQSWDHHDSIAKELPNRCGEIDKPAAALVKDLKQRGLLDSTIVHWGGEMGRLPVIQIPRGDDPMSRVGRDHNTNGFSCWVAGGGFKAGYTHGKTDDFSYKAIEGTVRHHDWLATILHLFGLNHQDMIYKTGGRVIKLVEAADARVASELLV